MGFKGAIYAGMILVTVLLRHAAGQTIGKCDLTTFTNGGQQCQRTMISNLKNNASLNCSFEYGRQSICLNGRVSGCVDGVPPYDAFKREIVQLLELLVYHCGQLSFDVSSMNPLLLNLVGCDAGKLKEMVSCWDEFRTTFNASRNDSSLCSKYAEGKQKCTNKARESCKSICQYITKDAYNPFCANGTDPPAQTALFDCNPLPSCTNIVVYENAMKCDTKSIKDFASGENCNTVLPKNKNCLREELVKKCSSVQEDKFFDDSVKTLRATLMVEQFFCNKVTLDKAAIHENVKTGDCQQEFFTDAEKCAEPFRSIYSNSVEKKSQEVCTSFAVAKKCLNKVHEESCNFDESTLKAILFNDENPFCENGKDPLKNGVNGAQATIPFLFVISIVFSLVAP
ncbi:uncharacterized protein LOC111329841 [Stylophora pistillata]|uniref:Uncharacterized protein n=1 Tax=Stylophora pistillata TaxID=50429 RepID=A0A2B4S545_STYPI|nr:uncharacterized protein LOC111329841 [Stylophora pistillata]PFX25814.1 hypothetical protein AWC38_SpisGene9522 [Stylophora pistillata]